MTTASRVKVMDYKAHNAAWSVFETDHSLLVFELCACLPKKRRTVARPKCAVQLLLHEKVRQLFQGDVDALPRVEGGPNEKREHLS